MATLVQIVIIMFLMLIILLQRIDITLSATSATLFKISSVIWSVSFRRTGVKARKSKLKLSTRLSFIAFALRVLNDLVPKSDVTVLGAARTAYGTNPISHFMISLILPATLAYVSRRANSCEIESRELTRNSSINLSFPLLSLCISALKVAYYTIRSKVDKRG